MQHRTGLRSLRGKLNLLVIVIILALSAGLMWISYSVFCEEVEEGYYDRLERAAQMTVDSMPGEWLLYFWDKVSSDEYRELQDLAKETGDDSILKKWFESQPSYYIAPETFEEWMNAAGENDEEKAAQLDDGQEITVYEGDDEELYLITLLDDYEIITSSLQNIREYLRVDNAYYQIDLPDGTYNIAGYEKDFFFPGTKETPLEEFAEYEDNEKIEPTVYRSELGWLCTAMDPVRDQYGNAVALGGADVNMTDVMDDRHSFLIQSFVFVLALMVAAIVVSMSIMERVATRPLQKLADAAKGFARGDERYTKEDVIDLDIHSNDEIGVLYHEIQSMQGRIVEYTDHMIRITKDKERVETELHTAARIQKTMLPALFPAFPDRKEFDLYASMNPAKEVGGDFYDYLLVDEDHLAVLIADVSDKGVPAALFMMASRILLNYRTTMGGTPGEILQAVNEQIAKGNASKMFVTVWLGILDLNTGVMTCASAGHEFPAVRGQDGVFRVLKDKHSVAVGVFPGVKYQDYEIEMKPGDAVFVYTDGVPEASNESEEFYNMERVEATLNRIADQSPEGIVKGMCEDIEAFTGEADQFDDMTMLCLAYYGSQQTEDGTEENV